MPYTVPPCATGVILTWTERLGKAIKCFFNDQSWHRTGYSVLGLDGPGLWPDGTGRESLARHCCRRGRRHLESRKMTLRVPRKFSFAFFLEPGSSNPNAMDRFVSSSQYRKTDLQYLWYKLLLWIDATLCKCTWIWILSLLCSAGYKQKCWAPACCHSQLQLPQPCSARHKCDYTHC